MWIDKENNICCELRVYKVNIGNHSIVVLTIFLSSFLQTSCIKHNKAGQLTEERFRTFIHEQYPELTEKKDFTISKVDFFTENVNHVDYKGAEVQFEGRTPKSYTCFVLTDDDDADLKNIIKQFEYNQKVWNYSSFEIDNSVPKCLIVIQND